MEGFKNQKKLRMIKMLQEKVTNLQDKQVTYEQASNIRIIDSEKEK